MKKIILLASLMVGTAFSQEASTEFERGYQLGAKSCGNELWTCTVQCPYTGTYRVHVSNGAWVTRNLTTKFSKKDAEGFSKADALSKLIANVSEECLEAIRSGKTECKSL